MRKFKMNKNNIITALAGVCALSVFLTLPINKSYFANATDKPKTKLKNKVEDVKRDSKKQVRKAKKKHREANGTNDTLKDAKDEIGNMKDDMTSRKNKLKNKMEE